jgi:hypothetical protein
MTTTQHLREKPNETEALEPPAAEPSVRRSAVSRRGLLGATGVGLAGLAAGAAGGFALGSEQPAPTQAPMPGLRTYPFYGQHQAGILTPMQDRLHFAAFDVITESREELVQLLKDWTAAAARMTQGLAAKFGPTSGPYAAPPDDTGEAIGLPPGVYRSPSDLVRRCSAARARAGPASLTGGPPHCSASSTFRPTSSTRKDPTATCVSRPVLTTRRLPCMPSETLPGSPSAGRLCAGPNWGSAGRLRHRPARRHPGTSWASKTAP